MLRVAAYTGGLTVPSARFRVRQYIPRLTGFGIDMRESAARFGSYPPTRRLLRPAWGVVSLAERLGATLGSHRAQLTFLQREMLSTLFTVERFTKGPRVLDVDDAIWLNGDGNAAVELARRCELVVCGNEYLAEFFRARGCHVAVLPTPVDTERFRPAVTRAVQASNVICWSGTNSGHRYLRAIEPALAKVLRADRARRLRVISDSRPDFQWIDADQVEFVEWSEKKEVEALQSAGVGIMPLEDGEWSRGKCSYKLLTYMACGLPVVASPVGMNAELLKKGSFGTGASTLDEWTEALHSLLARTGDGDRMGQAGRELVVRDYSLDVLAPRLASVLRGVEAGQN